MTSVATKEFFDERYLIHAPLTPYVQLEGVVFIDLRRGSQPKPMTPDSVGTASECTTVRREALQQPYISITLV